MICIRCEREHHPNYCRAVCVFICVHKLFNINNTRSYKPTKKLNKNKRTLQIRSPKRCIDSQIIRTKDI